ncbi:16S rRNA (uracil(1498)-N(3))-methyltransferase [Oceanospirillum sediminis]|uniref:Ribosomal RNA small subunit methyltransferase E n=1 Tax=Oceanospirillum sediminis TaxID=2760088 RepID=A0A839IXS8_9GAMM|nr:16S rRNA (uracil(1498)-N(3))-methyltransferase [Oceanospirillum sediminis]MBB1489249.1 16S rRNA (uracil(1498)-N(3))-methyltransferase [Oceanospirillum sediminis]
MNLILLFDSDFISENTVKITGRRAEHVIKVHKAQIGDLLTTGLLNGKTGKGLLLSMDKESVTLEVNLTDSPPAPLPLTLILALPRPRMLGRTLQHISTLGVKKLILLNTKRVEKSYWMSPVLAEDKVQEQLILGLEQAKDTVLPDIILEKQFRPFVEDRLPEICQGTLGLVAHPGVPEACPRGISEPTTLAIGPEGGFIPYEIEKLSEAGLAPVHMGERIMRVETAVTALLARLF